ncbi:MAG TPA: thioesterase family protein [Gammaproteobacteria bacterium]
MSNHSAKDRHFVCTCNFDPMPFEVDFTGYLSNTVIVCWMEALRVRMMRTHFSEINTGARENLSVIIRTEVQYQSAIRYGDLVCGTIWLKEITAARWRVGFDFHVKSKINLAVTAEQEGSFLDPTSFRPTRVPEVIRKKFLALTEDMD